jgi:hypothetical protein
MMMIGRFGFFLAFICWAGMASAQDACTIYKVNTSLLNISKEAGGDIYNDALFDGDIVCVTRKQTVNGAEWAYISNKLEGASVRTPVDGWSDLKYLQALSADDARAALAGAKPPATRPTAAPTAPMATVAPSPAPAAAAIRPEDILRFDQPIPFGPYPLNGHALQEMIDSMPQFPPIEGLDESLWKKKCTSCHQWNQARLCEQGATYVKSAKMVLRVPHPFGGAFKLALMRWAKSGCQ